MKPGGRVVVQRPCASVITTSAPTVGKAAGGDEGAGVAARAVAEAGVARTGVAGVVGEGDAVAWATAVFVAGAGDVVSTVGGGGATVVVEETVGVGAAVSGAVATSMMVGGAVDMGMAVCAVAPNGPHAVRAVTARATQQISAMPPTR